jgi:eukaryotic-like serine/threonine-protein kinase
VLAVALERPSAERDSFIDEACGGDVELRAEVESLLGYHRPDDDSEDTCACRNGEVGFLAFDAPTEGRIGPYKIVRELGRGGMAEVFLAARADDQYRQEVAIKLIRPGLHSDFLLKRFRNERQILAGLDHPNIAQLLDGGSTDAGSPYLVMEYVRGVPIDVYCDQHQLDIQARLKLFREACAAIHYAHQHKVIHRDIKPSNILVDVEGRLKLLDFGIAKILTPELAAQTLDPTLTSLRLMTPAYASPEQVKGDSVTSATDVYSLGVLLYELLTGHRPYRVIGSSPHEISQAVLQEEPVKPSAAISLTTEVQCETDSSATSLITPESVSRTREGSPDRLRRRLRGDLDNIVLTALRKNPEQRYASVELFSDDIRRHLEGLPVLARGKTLPYHAARLIGRNRLTAALICLSLFVTAALVHYALSSRAFKQPNDSEMTSLAVIPFKSNSQYLGPGIADGIATTLMNLKRLVVRPSRTTMDFTSKIQDPLEAGRALQVDAILVGTVEETDGIVNTTAELLRVDDGSRLWRIDTRQDLRDFSKIEQSICVEVTRALGLESAGPDLALATPDYNSTEPEAWRLYLKARYLSNQKNAKDAQEGISCFERLLEVEPNCAAAHAGLAFSQIAISRPMPFLERMKRAKEEAIRALELDDRLTEAHIALGRALTFCDWDWAGAEREFKRAIELSPKCAEAHYWYADNLSATGHHDAAISELKLVEKIDPFSPRYHFRFGWAYYFAGMYDQAIDQFRKTPLYVDDANFQVYWRLGMVYLAQSRYEQAISMIKNAETLSGELPLTRASLAYAHAKSGNKVEARRMLVGFNRAMDQAPYLTVAAAYAALGDKAKAFEWLAMAYEKRDNRIIHIKVEPMLESLRSDPRFEALSQRIGLPAR